MRVIKEMKTNNSDKTNVILDEETVISPITNINKQIEEKIKCLID